MIKKIIILLMFVFTISGVYADDTGIELLPFNNTVEWLDNQRKPVSGEKIFANLKSLANHIYSDSAYLNNKINEVDSKFYADSIIQDNRITQIENFNLSLEDTFLSKTNNAPYTPVNDYHPATKKFVLDNVVGGSGVDTAAVLIIIEPDSISKNLRITLLEADSAAKNLLINNIENDSLLKNIRINALEYFKSTINDTFYTETEINSFLNSIGVDTTLLKNNIIILQTQINNISSDSITTGTISYLRIEDKFLRNDIEDTGFKLNLTNDLYVANKFKVDGEITLGKIDGFGNKPDLILNANLKTDLIPSGNNYNLGSAATRWKYVYADTMIATTLGADSTEISGTLLPNFTINSGNDTFENSSITFYQADTEKAHGNILYRYATDDFLFNKPVSINGDVLSNGTFSGKADSLVIDSTSVKSYIDNVQITSDTKFNQVAVDTTLLSSKISNILTWDTVTKQYVNDSLALKVNVLDSGLYAAINTKIDTASADLRYLKTINYNPGIDTSNADLRYLSITADTYYADWNKISNKPSVLGGQNIYDVIVAADGSGDYTSIAQAVNNSAIGKTIYIKNGTYSETVNIMVKSNQKIIGESANNVIINLPSNSFYLSDINKIEFYNLTINGTYQKNDIFIIDYVNIVIFENISIKNCRYGFYADIFGNGYFNNIKIEDAGYGVYLKNSHYHSFNNIYSARIAQQIFYITWSHNNNFNNLTAIEVNGGFFFNNSNKNIINTAYITDPINYAIFVEHSNNNTFSNILGQSNKIGIVLSVAADNNKISNSSINLTISAGAFQGSYNTFTNNIFHTNININGNYNLFTGNIFLGGRTIYGTGNKADLTIANTSGI